MSKESGARNTYIDACRGIAAIQVIIAHTAYYGLRVAPEWFRNVFLLFEVPFFFFLSGWGSSYSKPDVIKAGKGILRIWAQWIVFILTVNIFCFISMKFPFACSPIKNPADLVRCLFFDETVYPGFFVIGASVWFIPLYFAAVLINNAALTVFKKTSRPAEYAKAYLVFLIFAVLWAYFHPDYFGYYPPFIMFYCTIWMIGYLRAGKERSFARVAIEYCICLAGLALFTYLDFKLRWIPVWDIQSAKTIPSGKYLFVSMLSIIVFGYLERFVKNPSKILVHIGKNAIFYFFGQGIGTSVVNRFLADPFGEQRFFQNWLLCACVNIVISVIVAEGMSLLYKQISRLFKYLLSRLQSEPQA